MTLSVAYLVNQYPKVSHTFVRREIAALERLGVAVERFAVRGWDAETPDPADAAEQKRTRYLLRDGIAGLVAPTLAEALRAPGRFAHAVGVARRLSRRAERGFAYHLVYLAEACRLLGWLRAAKAAHLHAHFGTNAAAVAMLARALGGPSFSFTVHGPEEFDKPQALHLADKAAASAFVVAISSYGRSQLYRWLAARDWPKVEVVRCGVDRAFLGSASTSDAKPAACRIVCVGRLCEQKGQLLLVQAMARLASRGVEAELVLAGDGEMRADVERAIACHRLGDRVRITGWIGGAEVKAELLAARALVLPSFAEGLPVVVMEAMALGRPVVSTYVAGIPELVRDGETGWLVPAGDVEALAAAIEAALTVPDDAWSRMGEAARRRVAERHDVDREAAVLAGLFARSAAAETSASPSAAAVVESR